MRAALLLAGALAAGTAPLAAQPLTAGPSCGGDAYSSAQVIEGRPPRHGPLVAVPETLCADLGGPPPPVTVDVYAGPGLYLGEPGLGAFAPRAPYGERSRRGRRPPPLSSE